MARTDNLGNYLEDVAIAIKNKKGDNSLINASNFDIEIEKLPIGEDISDYFGNITSDVVLTDSVGRWLYLVKKIPHLTIIGNNCNNLFMKCKAIEILGISSEQPIISAGNMFNACDNLMNLNMNDFNMGNITNIVNMFTNAINIKNLIFGNNLGKGYYAYKISNRSNFTLNVSDCIELTHDSLMDVINKLYDLNLTYNVSTGGTLHTQQLIIGSTNVAKLTEEEIAIATAKGWTVL